MARLGVHDVSSNAAQQCQPSGFSDPSLVFSAMTNAPTVNRISAFGAVATSANDAPVDRWITSARFAHSVASPNCVIAQRVSTPPL
ncbi:hypothetical protein D3C71_1983570 [compost metagenome]